MVKVDIDYCLAVAIGESKSGNLPKGNYSHWSFIFQGRKFLTYARNIPRQEYVMKRYGYNRMCGGIHSEVAAIRKGYGLLDRRKPWEIVNISLTALHTLRMSCPCPLCVSFIRACGCSTCHFSIIDGWAKVSIQ